jgi:hypothetical protein
MLLFGVSEERVDPNPIRMPYFVNPKLWRGSQPEIVRPPCATSYWFADLPMNLKGDVRAFKNCQNSLFNLRAG